MGARRRAIPWAARSFASRSARTGRSTGGKEPHAWVPPLTDSQRAARTTFQRNSTPPPEAAAGTAADRGPPGRRGCGVQAPLLQQG